MASIKKLTPRETAYEVADGAVAGLTLRVHPSGVKSWRWRLRTSAVKDVISLGQWSEAELPGHTTLADARKWVERLRAAAKAGVDQLRAVEAELKACLAPRPGSPAPSLATGESVKAVAEGFLRMLRVRRKVPEDAARTINVDILPLIGDLPLRALKKADCRRVVERVVERGATTYAARVLALLKQMLRWASRMEEDWASPADALVADDFGCVSNIRDRWLNRDELTTYLAALREAEALAIEPSTERAWSAPELKTLLAFRLLLSTGVRAGSLLRAEWSHVDFKAARWSIPVENLKMTLARAKRSRPFVVPLTAQSLSLFQRLKDMGDENARWVLSSEQASSGRYSDKALSRAMLRFWTSHPKLSVMRRATVHDNRRTLRSGLSLLGVQSSVAESCLQHSQGRLVATYQQADDIDARRAALTLWDTYLERLENPKANVVPLKPVAGA